MKTSALTNISLGFSLLAVSGFFWNLNRLQNNLRQDMHADHVLITEALEELKASVSNSLRESEAQQKEWLGDLKKRLEENSRAHAFGDTMLLLAIIRSHSNIDELYPEKFKYYDKLLASGEPRKQAWALDNILYLMRINDPPPDISQEKWNAYIEFLAEKPWYTPSVPPAEESYFLERITVPVR